MLWLGLNRIVREQAGDRALHDLESLDDRMSDYFDGIERGVSSLASLWRNGGIDPARLEPARLGAFAEMTRMPWTGQMMLVALPGGPGVFVRRVGAEAMIRVYRPLDERQSAVNIYWQNADGSTSRPPERARQEYLPCEGPGGGIGRTLMASASAPRGYLVWRVVT